MIASAKGDHELGHVFVALQPAKAFHGFEDGGHIIQPFDQEKWARCYETQDADAALATFGAVRNWNVALLEKVTPEQLSRRLTHPERGEMTFQVVIETMAGHDLNHLKQLEAIATKSR